MVQTSANYQRQASNENFISYCTHFDRSSDSYSELLIEGVLEVLEIQLILTEVQTYPEQILIIRLIIASDKQLDTGE